MLVRPMARCNAFSPISSNTAIARARGRHGGDHQKTASSLEDRERSHVVGKGVEEGFQPALIVDLAREQRHHRRPVFRAHHVGAHFGLKRSGRGAAAVASRSPFSPDVAGVLASLLRLWPSGVC